MQHQQDAGNGPAAAARRPAFDYHHAIGMQGGVYMHYTVQASACALPCMPPVPCGVAPGGWDAPGRLLSTRARSSR